MELILVCVRHPTTVSKTKSNMKYYGPGFRLMLLLNSFDIIVSLFSAHGAVQAGNGLINIVSFIETET